MNQEIITMSIKELKRLHVVKKADEKLITQKEAAQILDLSERQFRRIIFNFRTKGPSGLIHQLREKPSERKFDPLFSRKIAHIYKNEFFGYKPTFFTEKLKEEYRISISKEAARQILMKNNLWIPKKKKRKHRTKRQRKHHPGELVQLDGSVHQWFPGKDGYCVLMLYIDDASSRVFARFYTYEGTLPAMDSFRRYTSLYGMPMALYADLHGTYKNNKKKLSIEEQLAGLKVDTQFSRALRELSVTIIPAYSPQAKGRVERSFGTFQDRLVKELHRHNIRTIHKANIFLVSYLKDHNRRFSIKPHERTDLHRPALPAFALKKILCIQHPCTINNDFTIRHDNHIYQLTQSTIARRAIIEKHTDGSIRIRINNNSIPFKDITYKHQRKNQHKITRTIYYDPISLKEIAS